MKYSPACVPPGTSTNPVSRFNSGTGAPFIELAGVSNVRSISDNTIGEPLKVSLS
ncbi:hypothetical protein D3C86_2181920 [compost metagenome]